MSFEEKTFGETTIVFLKSDEDAEQWSREQKELSFDFLVTKNVGPGWYVPSVERERCRMGCCWDHNMYLESIGCWLAEQGPLLEAVRGIDALYEKETAVSDVHDS